LRKTLLSLVAVAALAAPTAALAGGNDPDPIDPPTAGTLPTIPTAVPLPALPTRVTTGLPVDPTDPPTFSPGNQRRIQVQRFGCLGEIDIRGGASVTPIASVHFLRCARVPGRTINYPIATPLRAH
jgi:hypothetical protein